MRTTLTLDPDVAASLERLRRQSGRSLKEIANDALRRGLEALARKPPRRRARYKTPTVSLGRCLVGNLDDVADVLAVAEGEDFK